MAKYDLEFDAPLMNAAGSLGFSLETNGAVDWNRFGAFVTHPVSLRPRQPAHPPCFFPYNGGFLLHTGFPNPGVKAVVRRHSRRWSSSPLPVLVHLLAQDPAEARRLVDALEGMVGVAGFELGLPGDIDPQAALALAQAAAGELPVILRLPLERAFELASSAAQAVQRGEVAAISLGPPRGMVSTPQGGLASGRLYGPAIFPLALAAVKSMTELGLPVIAAGGIYTEEQVQAMLGAGALAVQLDAVLWRGGWGENA